MKGRIQYVAVICSLLVVLVLAFGFTNRMAGSVRGTVTPPEGGLRAYLYSAKDTLSVNIVSGRFQFSNVNAGSYRLVIEAAPPYRAASKESILVTEGDFTDAGEIQLQK